MFAGIQTFTADAAGASLVAMQSAEGEVVALPDPVSFSGETEVNVWLSRAEAAMREALCASLGESVKAGVAVVAVGAAGAGSRSPAELFAWMDASPAQVALVALQVLECQAVEADLAGSTPPGAGLTGSTELCAGLLALLADAVLEDLPPIRRKKAEQFIGELVHQQNVVRALERQQVADFVFVCFLRVRMFLTFSCVSYFVFVLCFLASPPLPLPLPSRPRPRPHPHALARQQVSGAEASLPSAVALLIKYSSRAKHFLLLTSPTNRSRTCRTFPGCITCAFTTARRTRRPWRGLR